jgi:endonuclease YncB( thermonuclease family)
MDKEYYKDYHMNKYISNLRNTNKNTQEFNFNNCTKIAKVVDVYDGDTVKACFSIDNSLIFYKFNIRLYGYNSEEIRQKKDEPLREQKKELAIKQKKALEEMVLDKIVHIECLGFDKYGRILGKIFLDNEKKTCVNDIMVQDVGCKIYII